MGIMGREFEVGYGKNAYVGTGDAKVAGWM